MADTEQPELTLERFRSLVEAYGSDLERFPSRERAAARQLLVRSDSARKLVEARHVRPGAGGRARGLGHAFDGVDGETRADPRQHAQRTPVLRLLPFRSPKQTWLLAAAAVLLGVLGGGYDAVSSSSSVDTAQADIVSLAFADDLFDDLSVQEGDLQ